MTADTVGGVWQYAIQLCSLLATRGTRVMLATMGPEPSTQQRAEADAVPDLVLRSSTYALEWMPESWPDVERAGEWLGQLEAEFAPEIVHLNGYCHATLAWHAPRLVAGHSCVYSWWRAVHGCRPGPEWLSYRQRVGAGLRAADAVAAPSRAMADALEHEYDVRRAVVVIPNCRSWNSAEGVAKEPMIFAAGRMWDPAKNLLMLDQSASDIPWPVYIAGDPTGPGGVPANGMTAATCLGRVTSTEVARWMARASIYALPARYEPFGLSVLEAALSGCALVLGDIPSLRENWDGVARFVHPGRPDELRDTLRHLIDRPDEREVLGQAARLRAEQFTPERHVRAYESLYLGMVMAHGRTAHSARSH